MSDISEFREKLVHEASHPFFVETEDDAVRLLTLNNAIAMLDNMMDEKINQEFILTNQTK